MRHYAWLKKAAALAFLFICPLIVKADILDINDDIQTYSSLSDTTVNMTGQSELHITDGTNPIPGCQINLNSSDSWFFLEQIKPSVVVSTYLSQVRVNGSPAVSNSNVRVVQYVSGAVVIPHSPTCTPLQIYSGFNYTGSSMSLGLSKYDSLGGLNNNISSFKLKRGYMATFAQNANGSGLSRTYVAQDKDINIIVMPEELNNSVSCVYVFPWRWVGKKGGCDDSPLDLDPDWWYDWGSGTSSTQDAEYVAMRHHEYSGGWDSLNRDWWANGVSHLLGWNEPDKSDQANLTVSEAISYWAPLSATGLRLGAPAVSDGGRGWLYDFIDQADAAGLRVDYVPIHYYWCYGDNGNPAGAANQLYTFLRDVHNRTGRPVWVTEWNNGAKWTGCDDPSYTQNRDVVEAMMNIMDETPWVERYAIYSKVEWMRQTHYDEGGLTPMGVMYHDHIAPAAYLQAPGKGGFGCAYYEFEDSTLDSLFYENNAITRGTEAYTIGHSGQAIDLDGSNDYVILPENLADCDDFTFAAWIYWDGGGQWQRIFDFGTNNVRYMFLTPRSGSNTLRFDITTTGNSNQQRLETTQLATGQWKHIAVTISGNTGKLFVNGSQVDINTSMTLNPSDLGAMTNYLGRSHFVQDALFNGRLDDVHIADYALTNAQITALYNGTLGNVAPAFLSDPIVKPNALRGSIYSDTLIYNAGDFDVDALLTFSKISGPPWLDVAADGTLSGTPGAGDVGLNTFIVRVTDNSAAYDEATLNITVNDLGLMAYYKFDGNTNDSIGSNHATATGSPSYTTGKIDQAIDLDGSNDYVTLPAGLFDTDDVTVAAWVNWDGGAIWQRIFDFGNDTSQYLFLTPSSYSNTLRFAITTSGSEERIETTQLATGRWVHVAVTLEGDTGTLYVNGSPADLGSITLNPSDFNPAINYIGDSQWSADPLFNGRIDDLRIYNYALSPTDITMLANGAANNAPYFISDLMVNFGATEDAAYSGQSLAASAVDLDGDTLTFSKVTGPSWLTVASDGSLSGTPSDSDVGENIFVIRVEDTGGLYGTAVMIIYVTNIYSGVRGMEDLAGLVDQWLIFDCVDTPACNGADLDGDADVDMSDLSELGKNWQAGF